MTVQAAELEKMFGDVAGVVERLRCENIPPHAIGIRSGSLHGISTVFGLPVIRLAADSPFEWGVITGPLPEAE